MSVVIRVENLSKKYILSHKEVGADNYVTIRDIFTEKIKSLSNRHLKKSTKKDPYHEDLWALQDVSFEVNQGDRIGIIGRNGAGKSTLLKILSRITEPTKGKVCIKGRVASLLEVGTGFHQELTGRENIYLNGAILGMGRKEIKRKFDEIVDFAEVERFLDTPVKRYSTGMYVRLAFAIAAHLEPEILIVDEVLAVGDAQFQKKCLGKMEDVSTKEGRTVLFVSHNMTAIKSLCKRCVWLEKGHIIEQGNASEVSSKYLEKGAMMLLEQRWDGSNNAPGNDKVRLQLVRLVPQDTKGSNITVSTPFNLEFEFWNAIPNVELNFSMILTNHEGICVLNSHSDPFLAPVGRIRGVCHVNGNLLNDGIYQVMIRILQDTSKDVYTHPDVLLFEVQDTERKSNWHGKWPGVVRPKLEWEIT